MTVGVEAGETVGSDVAVGAASGSVGGNGLGDGVSMTAAGGGAGCWRRIDLSAGPNR